MRPEMKGISPLPSSGEEEGKRLFHRGKKGPFFKKSVSQRGVEHEAAAVRPGVYADHFLRRDRGRAVGKKKKKGGTTSITKRS